MFAEYCLVSVESNQLHRIYIHEMKRQSLLKTSLQSRFQVSMEVELQRIHCS